MKQTKPLEVKKARNANYDLLDVAKKFKPTSTNRLNGTHTGLQRIVERRDDFKSLGDWYDNSFCANVSAPYVLARLCALFQGLQIDANGQDSYKTTWDVVLEHVETGNVLTFYDYKGGISYGSNVGNDIPDSFVRDVRELLEVLSDDRCPHPYDGCVVGEVA